MVKATYKVPDKHINDRMFMMLDSAMFCRNLQLEVDYVGDYTLVTADVDQLPVDSAVKTLLTQHGEIIEPEPLYREEHAQ